MYKNYMLKDFIDELSSYSPAPGGGSVAALAAALGSALTSMVFNLTIGKKAYESLDDNIKFHIRGSLEKENENKFEFLDYIDKDADAFLSLMSSFKLPKSSEEEINRRSDKIQEGTKGAIEVPLKLAEKSYLVYESVLLSAKYGNVNAASDAGVAALMLSAAIDSAMLNVKINISSIKDEEYLKNINKRCSFLIEESNKRKREILDEVDNKIK